MSAKRLFLVGLGILSGALLSAGVHAQAPTYLTQWGTPGSGNGQFNGPEGVAVDAGGNVYVADTGNDRIQKFGPVTTATKSTSWGRIKTLHR